MPTEKPNSDMLALVALAPTPVRRRVALQRIGAVVAAFAGVGAILAG
jgi:hypothetical protein